MLAFTAAAATLLVASASAASFSSDPNAPCGVQPFGYGPPSVPDSDSGFESSPIYQYISLVAPAPTNYTTAFRNLTGATQQPSYSGFYYLQSYNTTQCAQFCSAQNGCMGFNIYFERDPLLNPSTNCTNPPSTVQIKCSLFQTPVSNTTATNNGQYRNDFHVVIAGSDGFNHK